MHSLAPMEPTGYTGRALPVSAYDLGPVEYRLLGPIA